MFKLVLVVEHRVVGFSVHPHRHSATQLGGVRKELQPSRAALGAPQMTGVEKLFPLSLASRLSDLGCLETLDKHPCTDEAPALKSLQGDQVILP